MYAYPLGDLGRVNRPWSCQCSPIRLKRIRAPLLASGQKPEDEAEKENEYLLVNPVRMVAKPGLCTLGLCRLSAVWVQKAQTKPPAGLPESGLTDTKAISDSPTPPYAGGDETVPAPAKPVNIGVSEAIRGQTLPLCFQG